jgi:nitrate/nitrite transport system substrate-binding protein
MSPVLAPLERQEIELRQRATSTSKTFVVMGKTFDPSKPDDYVQSFSIKRS